LSVILSLSGLSCLSLIAFIFISSVISSVILSLSTYFLVLSRLLTDSYLFSSPSSFVLQERKEQQPHGDASVAECVGPQPVLTSLEDQPDAFIQVGMIATHEDGVILRDTSGQNVCLHASVEMDYSDSKEGNGDDDYNEWVLV
jgi:hypothetical protein